MLVTFQLWELSRAAFWCHGHFCENCHRLGYVFEKLLRSDKTNYPCWCYEKFLLHALFICTPFPSKIFRNICWVERFVGEFTAILSDKNVIFTFKFANLWRSPFQWLYKPIWELFYFFEKCKQNKFSWIIIPETVNELEEK